MDIRCFLSGPRPAKKTPAFWTDATRCNKPDGGQMEAKHFMDLYRIILADDEEEVRKSIIKKIDWTLHQLDQN